MQARTIKSHVAPGLMEQECVSGVGIGENEDGEEVVIINVEHGKSDDVVIPAGFSPRLFEIRETGCFTVEAVKPKMRAEREREYRPVPCGVSTGHKDITAGSTGFIVEDDNGNRYPSSNNHIYANTNEGMPGDDIYQPGPSDGGDLSNKSGELRDYVHLEDGATLDFAWIDDGIEHTLELLDLGKPKGNPVEPSIGDVYIKSGRTTGVTEAEVEQVDATIDVGFSSGSIEMHEIIITNDMSDGGDSGSAVLKKETMEPAGILFAGNDDLTAHCKAVNVESETGLTIVTEDMNETPTAEVTLTLIEEEPDKGNIHVSVMDESGDPLEYVAVDIIGPSEYSGGTGLDGSIVFEGVEIADWDVFAGKDGYESASTAVAAEDFN